MRALHLATVLLGVLTIGTPVELRGQESATPSNDQRPPDRQDGQITVTGHIVESHGPRLFTVRERGGDAREYLVLASRALSPTLVNATVEVAGTLRTFTEGELKRANAWDQVDDRTRQRFTG